ncbi:hypothetical protein C0584_04485 [Candidatus Parcubacteria bacterium]|nr:MAG: hypothetical protein C0584_04485 [Candidatus Parcubacteria bacterium]
MENKFQNCLKKKEKVIGSIASFLAIVMFVALIEVFMSNLRGDSRIIIQPLATAFNGFFWSLYAYGRKDYFLLVPNLLALILGALTVVSVYV